MAQQQSGLTSYARRLWNCLSGSKKQVTDTKTSTVSLSIEFENPNDPIIREWIESREAFEPIRFLSDEDARDAVTQSGLCLGRNADIATIHQLFLENPIPTGLDLRKTGNRIDAAGLRERALRGNVILSFECWEMLSPEGQRDPINSAQFIMSAYARRLRGRNDIARAIHSGVSQALVYPNNTAAGPCKACIALSACPIPIEQAPCGPLPECPHPNQCNLWHRSVFRIEGIDDDGNTSA